MHKEVFMTYTTSRLIENGPGLHELSVSTFTKNHPIYFSVWCGKTHRYEKLRARVTGVDDIEPIAVSTKSHWSVRGSLASLGIPTSARFEANYKTSGEMKPRGYLRLMFPNDAALDADPLAQLLGRLRPYKRVVATL